MEFTNTKIAALLLAILQPINREYLDVNVLGELLWNL